MIKLPVDEAYAFEYLAILRVKYDKCEDCDKKLALYGLIVNLMDELSEQLGTEVVSDIVMGDEFGEMLKVNSETFDMVDKAKRDEVKASEVDAMTFKRKLAKDALQKRFFPDREYVEEKFGYRLKKQCELPRS